MTVRPARWSPLRIVLGFVAVQLCIVTLVANGMSADEGIYATTGLAEWRAFPRVVGADVLNGSPWGWPLVAGPVFAAGGLTALRLVAVAAVSLSLWLVGDATRRLWGNAAAMWAVAVLALYGPTIALAHLAHYDVAALLLTAIALWSAARHRESARLRWLVAAGIALGAAIVMKYAYLFVAPSLALLVTAPERPDRRRRDAVLVVAIAALVVVLHDFAVLGSWAPRSFGAYQRATPIASRAIVALEQAYLALPLVLGALAARRLWTDRPASVARPDIVAMLGGALIWPLFHLATGMPQSANKHVVAGALFVAPLVGRWLGTRTAVAVRPARVMALLAVLGTVQWTTLEYSWQDAGATGAYLAAHVRHGDRVRSYAGTYRFLPYLVARDPEPDFAESREPLSSVRAEWVISEDRPGTDTVALQDSARAAGFTQVLAERSRWVGADDDRPFGLHRSSTRIFAGTRAGR